MRFQPKSKAEVDSNGLLEPGEYDFEIVKAEDKISKAGNEMIKLQISVFGSNGRKVTIFDYLMEKVAYKLRHAAEACGLESEYEAGNIEALDFEGRGGRCKLVIQKDDTGQYPDKNSIVDYLNTVTVGSIEKRTRKARATTPDMDDEVPF